MDAGNTNLIIFASIAFTLVVAAAIAVPALLKARKAFGPSKADLARAQELMASGIKARATVLGVQPTGMVVNYTTVGCNISFRIDPLDGRPSFQGVKDAFVNQTQMPRMGDVWLAWYDRDDPTQFVVRAAGPPSPDEFALFRQFGLTHPLDT